MADTYGMKNLILELAVAENLEPDALLPGNALPEGRLYNAAPQIFTGKFSDGLSGKQHSIASILTYWCEGLRGQVKPSTYSSYTYQVEHALIPYLGSRAAEEFHEQSMAEFLEKYQKGGRKNENGRDRENSKRNGGGSKNGQDRKRAAEPSESTLYLLEVILRRAFLYAVNQGVLAENPLGRLRMRPCQDAELTILPVEAVDAIKRCLAAKPALTRIEILLPLYTGCTLSELCALTWEEVNLEQKELYIRKNLFRVRETDPGSRARTALQLAELELGQQRAIHIPEILAQELRGMESRECLSGSGIYLLTGMETYIDPRTYQKHVRATLAECGIEEGSLTILRDTYVAMCLECGAGEYSLARQLGVEVGRLVTRYREYLQLDYSFLQGLR